MTSGVPRISVPSYFYSLVATSRTAGDVHAMRKCTERGSCIAEFLSVAPVTARRYVGGRDRSTLKAKKKRACELLQLASPGTRSAGGA